METPSWYIDWSFWTMATAILAILLSQLPPIHMLFKKARLVIEPFNRMLLTHTIGNPNVTLYLALENVGGKDIKVNSIDLEFTHSDGKSFSTPGQNYFPSENEPSVIMPPFRIKAGETWGHTILFYNLFNRDDEKDFRILVSQLKADIASKRKHIKKQDVVDADPALLDPIYDFFSEHNKWKAGEYAITIRVNTIPHRASTSKSFRFTLFETDAQLLKDHTEQYKTGLGVYYFDENQLPRISIPIINI